MKPLGKISLQFHSWWRTTSGHASGDQLDDVIQRSSDGLPWLPGRTIKGLLRDAAFQLAEFGRHDYRDVQRLFGTKVTDVLATHLHVEARYLTEDSTLRFDSLEMACPWVNWSRSIESDRDAEAIKSALFDTRAMTAIDAVGVAQTGSLRKVEVAAPVALSGDVWAVGESQNAIAIIGDAAKFVKSLGAGRNRGFGRAQMIFLPNSGES